ncbi:MAG: DUF1559 domain-containing protein [Planctomycetes bacterium]|nr:DUF1559 domain-containing protein [Planctomycetota bacterium]
MRLRFLAAFALIVAAGVARDGFADESSSAGGNAVRRYRMNPYHANVGRIESVAKDGTLRVVELANPRFSLNRRLANLPDLAEGLYLGFVGSEFTLSTRDTRLVRVRVVSVDRERSATLRIAPAAAEQIENGEQLVLFRPPGATTEEIEACPDYLTVDNGRDTTVLGSNSAGGPARLQFSENNLKQIGLALYNFADTHKSFPPAVIHGPDGKPWHSWRVVLLPYLDQAPLYNAYRWDEPWNGPNNSKLLSKMPQVYRDPAYGDSDDFYTHYAAVVGEDMAFPPEGIKMDPDRPTQALLNLKPPGAARIADFTDGLSNTLLVGSVGPERQIPWMKPEDVVFSDGKYPLPGEKGSFAAPYESSRGKAGVFLWGDGRVSTIRSDVDATAWQYLLVRNDGNPVDTDAIPSLDAPRTRSGKRAVQVVEIYRTSEGFAARLVASGDEE